MLLMKLSVRKCVSRRLWFLEQVIARQVGLCAEVVSVARASTQASLSCIYPLDIVCSVRSRFRGVGCRRPRKREKACNDKVLLRRFAKWAQLRSSMHSGLGTVCDFFSQYAWESLLFQDSEWWRHALVYARKCASEYCKGKITKERKKENELLIQAF